MALDAKNLVLANLRARPLRAWLTIVGIVIGVAAIISLITISYGLRNAIAVQFEKLGTNRIMVLPKGFVMPGTIKGLTVDDVDILEDLHQFEYVIPYLMGSTGITYKGDTASGYLWGVPAELSETMLKDYDMSVTNGRNFHGRNDEAVIGPLVGEVLFDRTIRVNDIIYLGEKKVRVVGIFSEIGNPEDDSSIMVPMELAREVFNDEERVDYIDMKLRAGVSVDSGVEAVKRALRRTHDSEDYQVITPEQLQQQFSALITVVEVIIIGIAAISLVVGGVGIMNSMFTSVLERKKEIGILKAVGARRSHIQMIFLAEAAVVALVGGIIGIAVGLGISFLVQAIAMQSTWSGMLRIEVKIWLLLLGMGFSLATGMLSGLLPAMQAAKMQPVDALRG